MTDKVKAQYIHLLEDRILVLPDEKANVTASGLMLPNSVKDKELWAYGYVEALGLGKRAKDGDPIDFDVVEGEYIMFNRHAAMQINMGGITYLIIREADVIMVVEEDK